MQTAPKNSNHNQFWDLLRMRRTGFWLLIGTCLLSSGCGMTAKSITGKFVRTMVVEPIAYCECKDDSRARVRYYQMAEQAWTQFASVHALPPQSLHFGAGFKDGYSEYLYLGGTGAPPPVPPRHYWNDAWQTPEGHQAMEHWYEGYRAGAAVAMSQGRYHVAVVPASHACAGPSVPLAGPPGWETAPSRSRTDFPGGEPAVVQPLPEDVPVFGRRL